MLALNLFMSSNYKEREKWLLKALQVLLELLVIKTDVIFIAKDYNFYLKYLQGIDIHFCKIYEKQLLKNSKGASAFNMQVLTKSRLSTTKL